MIEETAVVTEKLSSEVHLEIERRTPCGICGQTRGCGNATWGKMLGHQQGVIKANNTIDANVGDRVIVGIEEKVFLNATFLLYIVPLITLFLGAGLGELFFNHEGFVILGSTLGLVMGLIAVKKYVNMPIAGFSVINKIARQPYAVLLRYSDEVHSSN